MQTENLSGTQVESTTIDSVFLQREVKIDLYYPKELQPGTGLSLLLINDGQDLKKMSFDTLLSHLSYEHHDITPLLCVGIHCAPDRKMEYGVAGQPDFKGRGANAGLFSRFVTGELFELIRQKFGDGFSNIGYAGFSLGGLMALDIAWKHPGLFNKVGVFSGSLWWRAVDQTEDEYDDDKHRIMHQQIRNGEYIPGLKFFFQCGNMDETKDRNENGIIDSIDDTRDLIQELVEKGYDPDNDIFYHEMPDGKHDVATWGRAMPVFLRWAFGKSQ